ncbi:zinc finger protein 385B-like [Physella acuta]|uniref:zinc finger protein 385B-like n=1 Tax=Physella acuta TaxID=109671 RepID=UPI0027DAEEC7|nr:zinc finger protein 385B-like [Physella acuta]
MEIVRYNKRLSKAIQELFINMIVPSNFLLLIHRHNPDVLTDEDISRLRLRLQSSIAKEINLDLLDCMTHYEGWFDCLLKVLSDPELKQANLIPAFQRIKREVDDAYPNQGSQAMARDVVPSLESSRCSRELLLQSDSVHLKNQQKKNSGKTIPARTKETIPRNSEADEKNKLDCEICGIVLSSESQKKDHLTGTKHLNKVKELSKTDVQVKSKGEMGNEENLKKLNKSYNKFKVLPDVAKGQKPDPTPLENAQVASGSVSPIAGAAPKAKNIPKKKKNPPTPDLNVTHPVGPTNTSTSQSAAKNPTKDNIAFQDNMYSVALDKNGKGKCELCQVILSSAKIAKDHIDGKKHKSNLQALNLPT